MGFTTTTPAIPAKSASSTRRIATAGVAVLLVSACATALVSLAPQQHGLDLTSHIQQEHNLTLAQTNLLLDDRVNVFSSEKMHNFSITMDNLNVGLTGVEKTSRSLCLNKKLAELTVAHEDQQKRNQGVIGDGPWTSKGVRVSAILRSFPSFKPPPRTSWLCSHADCDPSD